MVIHSFNLEIFWLIHIYPLFSFRVYECIFDVQRWSVPLMFNRKLDHHTHYTILWNCRKYLREIYFRYSWKYFCYQAHSVSKHQSLSVLTLSLNPVCSNKLQCLSCDTGSEAFRFFTEASSSSMASIHDWASYLFTASDYDFVISLSCAVWGARLNIYLFKTKSCGRFPAFCFSVRSTF